VPELLPDPAREHFVLLVREVAARLTADHDVVAEVRVEAERCAAVYDYLRRWFIWAHNPLGREDG
jgi:hypothetical protein